MRETRIFLTIHLCGPNVHVSSLFSNLGHQLNIIPTIRHPVIMQALAFSTHVLRRNKPMQTMNISAPKNPGESLLKTSRRLPLML